MEIFSCNWIITNVSIVANYVINDYVYTRYVNMY